MILDRGDSGGGEYAVWFAPDVSACKLRKEYAESGHQGDFALF